MMLGRDETIPGNILAQVVNPTEYDNAVDAIIKKLHELFSWDLVNPTLWKLIGFTGGPVKTWLTRYIQTSGLWNESYTTYDSEKWLSYFKQSFGYDPELSKWYFDVLEQLTDQGLISINIYQPFNYTPTGTASAMGMEAPKEVVKYGISAVVIGAVIYFMSKSLLQKYG